MSQTAGHDIAKAEQRRWRRASGAAQRHRLDREVPDGYSAMPVLRGGSCSVDVEAVGYVYRSHHTGLIVDSIDNPVGAPARAEPVVHRRKKPLPDPVGVSQEGASDEFVGGRRDRFRQILPQRAADSRGCPQLISFFCVPAHCARRCLIASASSSVETCSPRAGSASDSASRFIVAASRMISSVSSSRSRSSGATRTAEGLPCTVTVTRSWWS